MPIQPLLGFQRGLVLLSYEAMLPVYSIT